MVYTDRVLECSGLKLFLFGNILKIYFLFFKKNYIIISKQFKNIKK